MNQSGYLGISTLQNNLPYDGGFCKWYYIPLEHINIFPEIDSLTQELVTTPTLVVGKSWLGPIDVPNDHVGFIETQKQAAAGLYYEQKLEFHQPGDNRVNRQILENMPYYQYIVVAKVRAGGYWVMLGNAQCGMKFSQNQDFGKGQFTNAKTEMVFTLKSQYKGLVLPSFAGIDSETPINGSTTTQGSSNDVEVIEFTTTNAEPIFNVNWTAARIKRFGIYPLIEVWTTASGTPVLDNASIITCDAAPPATTIFSINRTGADTGYIILK
jgi:hypothetical protein